MPEGKPSAVVFFALFLLASSLISSPAEAREPGTMGGSFLKIGAGPRASGMGEAQTAVADDAYAGYWNPGGLIQMRYPEFVFMHNEQLNGVNQQYAAYAHPLLNGAVLAAHVTRLAVNPFDSYDNNGARTGNVSSDDLALGLTAAHGFRLPGGGPRLGLGAGVKYVREKLADSGASTVAIDLGILMREWEGVLGGWARGLRFGVAARHLGPDMRFVSAKTSLPPTWAVGLALERRPWGDPLTFALDFSETSNDKAVVSFGGEYWLYRHVAFRLGYRAKADEGGLGLGMGVRIRPVQLDYSFTGYGRLGAMHRMGIAMRFGAPADAALKKSKDYMQQAVEYLRQDRAYEAILELNTVLDEDPGNARALELLRKAKSLLEGSKDAH